EWRLQHVTDVTLTLSPRGRLHRLDHVRLIAPALRSLRLHDMSPQFGVQALVHAPLCETLHCSGDTIPNDPHICGVSCTHPSLDTLVSRHLAEPLPVSSNLRHLSLTVDDCRAQSWWQIRPNTMTEWAQNLSKL